MAVVRIREDAELPWINPQVYLSEEKRQKLSSGELTVQARIREMGSADSPQLVEFLYEPDAEIQVHAHDEDEIMFVRAGEMHVGNRVLQPGASIYIAGGTLYGFKAGPNGLQILNFRPRQDITFYTREEFLANRKAVETS